MTAPAAAASPGRNVLFLSFDGLTDPLGQSQILPYLSGLAGPDTHVHILSFEKPERLAAGGAAARAQLAAHGIEWTPMRYGNRPPVLAPMLNLLRMRRRAEALHRQRPFDIVHCRSYLPALAVLPLRRSGARMLFDMRGFWPDERVASGAWRLSNPVWRAIYRYFKRRELQLVGEADEVVALTRAARQEMLTWPGCEGAGDKITVIPCCVDLAHFDPDRVAAAARTTARERLGLAPSDSVCVFLGSLGTYAMLDEMLGLFKAWLAREPSRLFLFVTLQDPELVRARARALQVPADRIRIVAATREEVPAWLALADAGMFFVRPAYFALGTSPTKLGELMAMGLPVITNAGVGDTTDIVRSAGAGVVLDGFGADDFSGALNELSGARFDPAAIRAAAAACFSLEDGVETYGSVYQRLAPVGLASGARQ